MSDGDCYILMVADVSTIQKMMIFVLEGYALWVSPAIEQFAPLFARIF